ncbi:MAG: UDP-N-acetylmuramoyl-L-alanyl-D-glutamate--2,6-diaminopimelate ligase [Candidatus Cloacimonetes bacterium]|nr:UDP-N-acetylmuramoyl-L-alanyl-D-glutamate--2,6-diaminopimelate ligase [Candidatus Cloacimonadota bacterium]
MGLKLYGVETTGLCSNTRYLKNGDIFYIMGDFDYNKYLPIVLDKNPKVIVIDQNNKQKIVFENIVAVEDVRARYRTDIELFYKDLISNFEHIGITGTKGKSTIAFSLYNCLKGLGQKVAYVGTMGLYYHDYHETILNTTLGLNDFIALLERLKLLGIKTLVSEVSSQGLLQERVPISFYKHRVFTDLSPEHLDCHLNMQNYFAEKLKFFQEGNSFNTYLLDRSDYAKQIGSMLEQNIFWYGLQNNSNLTDLILEDDLNGLSLVCTKDDQTIDIKSHLTGFFNGENLACVVSILLNMGHSLEKIRDVVRNLKSIPGRMEKICAYNGANIYVDFAHSSESLEFVLSSVAQKVRGDLCVVFGCGGDRDPLKRPLMAKSSEKYADKVFVSNDNPRFEDPLKIIEDIKTGFSKEAQFQVILDRKKAIHQAMNDLKDGDVLLICGKGHEDYQIEKDIKSYFSDKETVLEYAKS